MSSPPRHESRVQGARSPLRPAPNRMQRNRNIVTTQRKKRPVAGPNAKAPFLRQRTSQAAGNILFWRENRVRLYIVTVVFLASLTLTACSDPQYYSKTAKGALIGGVVGADAGTLVGAARGAPVQGAVVGAGVGALGGTAIGAALDAKDAPRWRSDRDWHPQWSRQHEFEEEEAEEAEEAEHYGRRSRQASRLVQAP